MKNSAKTKWDTKSRMIQLIIEIKLILKMENQSTGSFNTQI